MRTILLASLLLIGCASDGDDDVVNTDQRTLDTCTTSIDPDVPDFYQRYFECVTITAADDGTVSIETEDLPPHLSSYYPDSDPNWEEFDTSRGPEYRENPNTLSAKAFTVTIPADPQESGNPINPITVNGEAGDSPYEFHLGTIGVALDSVSLYSGLAAPGDDIATEVYTFDSYNAHPSPDGAYHYHTTMPGPMEVLAAHGEDPGLEVYGILCDGTVILGCTELDGSAPTGELDAQGGHVGDLVDIDGTTHFTQRYHTHVCADGHAYTPEIQYYAACD
jgi:hypothetical protein